MPFFLVQQDITKMDVDAVVNAANTDLLMGGGVCGAIFSAAGPAELRAACAQLAPIHTGDAVVTPGFNLRAKYIIHTAGPVYEGGHRNEQELLRRCYLNSLSRAVEHECESIAFPLISSGIYGYPKTEALRVAAETIQAFLNDHDLDVYLTVFGREAFAASEALFGEAAHYIDGHYVTKKSGSRRTLENRD